MAKADGFANQGNWYKAAPLFGEAEAAFRKSGDTRNALYAKFGRLHRDVESGAYRAVHDEVTRDLVNPAVTADALLKIRALSLLGNIDLNIDTRAGIEDWQEVLGSSDLHIRCEVAEPGPRGGVGLRHSPASRDLASAALALQQAIGKGRVFGDVAGQLHFTIWLANGMAHNGRPDAALRLLDRVTALAEKSGHEMPLDLYTARINALTALRRISSPRGRRNGARSPIDSACPGPIEWHRCRGRRTAEPGWPTGIRCRQHMRCRVGDHEGFGDRKEGKSPARRGGSPRRLSALYRKTHQPAKALAAIDRSIVVVQRVEEAYDLPRFVAEKAQVEIDLGNVRAADALYDRASP